jgi:hypothetical protein
MVPPQHDQREGGGAPGGVFRELHGAPPCGSSCVPGGVGAAAGSGRPFDHVCPSWSGGLFDLLLEFVHVCPSWSMLSVRVCFRSWLMSELPVRVFFRSVFESVDVRVACPSLFSVLVDVRVACPSFFRVLFDVRV